MQCCHIISPEGRIKKCGHYLFDEKSDVGFLDTSGNIIYNKQHFSMWIKADKKRGEKCVGCSLWAACFNSFCPLKSSLSNYFIDSSICSGEHQNIDLVLQLLLSSYNLGSIPVQEIVD